MGYNCCVRDCKPGPKPTFTERLHVQMRPEQRESLDRISAATGVSVSRLVRWFLDEGIFAFESNPKFKTLPMERVES